MKNESKLIKINESKLIKILLENDLVSNEYINNIIIERKTKLNAAREKISGIIYKPNLKKYSIEVIDSFNQKILSEISLPKNESLEYNKNDWDIYGKDITILDKDTAIKEGNIIFNENNRQDYGLVISKDFTYLYNNEIDTQPLLGVNICSNSIYPYIAKQKFPILPLDIYLSWSDEVMCIVDRGSGVIHLLHIESNTFIGSYNIRFTESIRGLNVAFSPTEWKIYLTDNVSGTLNIIDIKTEELERINLGLGILGNLFFTPDGKYLYLIVKRPKRVLHIIDIFLLESEKILPIKGKLFSETNFPIDPLVITLDFSRLIFLTYLNEPAPFTPVINIIDLEERKTRQRYSIKDGSRPQALAFGIRNPVFKENKDLGDLLLENNLIDVRILHEIRSELIKEEGLEEYKKEFEISLKDIEFKEQIVEEERNRERLRKEVEFFDKEIEVLELVTSPLNCPVCEQPMLGSWTCSACGIEIDKAEDRPKRKIASLNPLTNLSLTRVMLVSTLHSKIFELDIFTKNIFKQIDTLEFNVKEPTDVFLQVNGNLLVLDSSNNKILEIDSNNNIIWESTDSSYNLSKPKRFKVQPDGNLLIADTGNHRVFEITKDEKIIWQYGKKGLKGDTSNYLNTPYDVQKTHTGTFIIADTENNRILEIKGSDVIWEFEIEKPINIIRLFNEDTFILNKKGKILRLNEDKYIIWSFDLFSVVQDKISLDTLTNLIRLRDQNLLVTTINHIIEIRPDINSIIWLKSFDELLFPVKKEIKIKEKKEKKKDILLYFFKSKKHITKPPSNSVPEVKFSSKVDLLPILLPVVDSLYNRIFIINRKGVVWQLEEKINLNSPKMAELIENKSILIVDTDNNRVIEIEIETNKIIWEYEVPEPISAHRLPNNITLITDSINSKVIEVLPSGIIRWEYKNEDELIIPYHAFRTRNGNTLITDRETHRVIEIDYEKEIIWEYGKKFIPSKESYCLAYPEYAIRLKNNNTLIADTRNSRVIEVNWNQEIIWEYSGQKEMFLISPCKVLRLNNNNTLIYFENGRRIIEINSENNIVWECKL